MDFSAVFFSDEKSPPKTLKSTRLISAGLARGQRRRCGMDARPTVSRTDHLPAISSVSFFLLVLLACRSTDKPARLFPPQIRRYLKVHQGFCRFFLPHSERNGKELTPRRRVWPGSVSGYSHEPSAEPLPPSVFFYPPS